MSEARPQQSLAAIQEGELSPTARRALELARRYWRDHGLGEDVLTDTGSRAGRKIRKAQLKYLAVLLRRAGMDYATVSRTIRVSVSKARRLVAEGLADLALETAAEGAELRTFELGRLDAWLAALGPKIDQGSPEAVNTALALQARRLALYGAGIGRSGVMQQPLGSTTDGSSSGVATLSWYELRAGSVTGSTTPEALEHAKGLLQAALQAGAVRHGSAMLSPLPAPQTTTTAAEPLDLEAIEAGDDDQGEPSPTEAV